MRDTKGAGRNRQHSKPQGNERKIKSTEEKLEPGIAVYIAAYVGSHRGSQAGSQGRRRSKVADGAGRASRRIRIINGFIWLYI